MDRQSRLDAAVTSIQDRWGVKALHKLKTLVNAEGIPPIPSGFADLDYLLNGGIRVGCITDNLHCLWKTRKDMPMKSSIHYDSLKPFDPIEGTETRIKPKGDKIARKSQAIRPD
ncbi:MAG: hypothetical protein K8L91_00990 [Anaerolineae bacterium]|nr:hypothetical protein [Anaerolineae bacterium]